MHAVLLEICAENLISVISQLPVLITEDFL